MTTFQTEAEAREAMARIWRELHQTQEPEPQTGPPRAAPVQVSDQELALEALKETGMSENQAIRALALIPGTSEAVKDRIAEKRAARQALADAEAAERWRESPEGRMQAAQEALAAQQERASLAEAARALLVAEGQYGPDEIGALAAEEAILEAGLDLTPEAEAAAADLAQADDYEANAAALAEGDAASQAAANPTTTTES